jgi:hypothetical protein
MNEYLVHKLQVNANLMSKLAGDEDKKEEKKEDKKEGTSFLDNRNVRRGGSAVAGALASLLASKYMLGVKDTPTLVGLTAAGGLGGLGLHEALAAPEKGPDETAADKSAKDAKISTAQSNIENPNLTGTTLGLNGKIMRPIERAGGAAVGVAGGNLLYEGGRTGAKVAREMMLTRAIPADKMKLLGEMLGNTIKDTVHPIDTLRESGNQSLAALGRMRANPSSIRPTEILRAADPILRGGSAVGGGLLGDYLTRKAQSAATKWKYGDAEK